jgi:hypothetical protein
MSGLLTLKLIFRPKLARPIRDVNEIKTKAFLSMTFHLASQLKQTIHFAIAHIETIFK